MRKRIVIGLVFLPLIAAAQSLPARAPGLWQSTTTVTGANGQPLPNASNVMTLSCVDAATDQKFFTTGESHCSEFSISGSGQVFHIDSTCNQLGKIVHIAETLTYTSAQAVHLHAVLAYPSGPITISSLLAWQGPCLAGMQPGDEGSVVAGAFSKSDNVDDPANR
jgi:hypothetical protein